MIRPLSLFILLAASPAIFAQSLYKWVEDDGSITFSVKPPPGGVDFETVETNGGKSATLTPSNEPGQITTPMLARSLPSRSPSAATESRSQSRRDDTSLQSANADTRRFSSDPPVFSGDVRSTSIAAPGSQSQKQRQCEDLQKRIVSLERRLRQSLSAEDMDNTVVYMAKYQRSLNQHCVQ